MVFHAMNIRFPLWLLCFTCSIMLAWCMFSTGHVPCTLASLLRDLQAGCKVMELEKTNSIAWLCKEICLCLRKFSGSGLSPWAISCLLPSRQDTAVGHESCCRVLGIHAFSFKLVRITMLQSPCLSSNSQLIFKLSQVSWFGAMHWSCYL